MWNFQKLKKLKRKKYKRNRKFDEKMYESPKKS